MIKTRRLTLLLLGIVVANVNGQDVSRCLSDNCYSQWEVCNADMVCSMWIKQGTDWAAFEVVAKLNAQNTKVTPLYECGKAPCATSKTYSSSIQTATPKCSSYGKNCETCAENGCTWEGSVCSDYCSLQSTEAKAGCKTTIQQCQQSYDPNKAYNGQSGYTCVSNEDCSSDEECNRYGMCATMSNSYCVYDTDCSRGFMCRGGGCMPSGMGSGRYCIFDDDCGYGYACRNGGCNPVGGGGGSSRCYYDNECPSQMRCYNGYCNWANTYAAARATDVMTMSEPEATTVDADDQDAQTFGGSTSFAAGVSFGLGGSDVTSEASSTSDAVAEAQDQQEENTYNDDEAIDSLVPPPPPQFLSVHKRTPSSISLVWASSDQGFHCETQVYRVAYQKVGTPYTFLAFFEEGVTMSSRAYITVNDLEPDSRYSFQVTAYHSSYAFHGKSSQAAATTARTKREGKRAKGKRANKGKKGGPNARAIKKQKKEDNN